MMPVMVTAMAKALAIIDRRRTGPCMHRWRECDYGSSTARLRTAQQVQRMQAGQPRRKRLRKALAQMQELFRGVKARVQGAPPGRAYQRDTRTADTEG